MNTPFLNITHTGNDWQASFAFQVFHLQSEEWMKMRWGFNAGALLDEAIDRHKFFIESQAMHEAEFHAGVEPHRTLALRGINLPGIGLQMALLGKVNAQSEAEAQQMGLHYARELYSTFPHDFFITPAESSEEYHQLSGTSLITANSSIAQIQRGVAFVQPAQGRRYFSGLWQASARSNEQIWRSLCTMPDQVLFNVLLQPTFFYDRDRLSIFDLKKHVPAPEQINGITSAYIPWAEDFINRRLAPWKKFFLMQVHILADKDPGEGLLRSIGSAMTRDTNELPLPGYLIKRPDSDITAQIWREQILAMDMVPSSRMEDLADSDEAFAVFRFPYLPEAGLPGAEFVSLKKEPPTQDGLG